MRIEEELEKRGVIICPNEGVSMLPLLRQHRDLMVIRKKSADGLKRFDAVLFRRGERYVLHRIIQIKRDGYVLCGDHQYRREYGVKEQQIIGILAAIIRDGREISTTDIRIRMYVHLWCDFFLIRAGILFVKTLPGRIKRRLKHE